MTTRTKNFLVGGGVIAVAAAAWWFAFTILRPAVMPAIPIYQLEMWAGGMSDDPSSDRVSSKPEGFLKINLRPAGEVLGSLEVRPFITLSNGEVRAWPVWFDKTPANVFYLQARIADLPIINTPGEYQLTVIIGRSGQISGNLAEAKKLGSGNDWTLVEGRITVFGPDDPTPPHIHR